MNKIFCLIISLFFITIINAQENNHYKIKNVSSANTKYSDFGVSFRTNNTIVFASSGHSRSLRSSTWIGNGQPYLNIYEAKLDSTGNFFDIKNYSKKIKSKYHDSNAVFTKDGKTVYFSSNNINGREIKSKKGILNIKIYKADVKKNGSWKNIQELPFSDANYDTGHPALNEEENKLYFVSNMPGTYGETDIYFVDILPNNTFGKPVNLGATVNTSGKEMFPYISKNNVLYFSSNGFKKGNDLDILATKLVENKAVYSPVNLGYPINTDKDDYGVVLFPNNSKKGYFSSDREGGKGDDDIYLFEELIPLQFDKCTQFITGNIKDVKNQISLPETIVTLKDKQGNIISKVLSNSEGKFKVNIDCEVYEYTIESARKNYKVNRQNIDVKNINIRDFNIDLEPDEVNSFKGVVKNNFITMSSTSDIDIFPIFFDVDDYKIRPKTAIELERVIRILKKYPSINIELQSHTDSRHTKEYNQLLSNKRAISTQKWLLERGINSDRISIKAYGETKLLNHCKDGVKCSQAHHQINRRIEFVILNK